MRSFYSWKGKKKKERKSSTFTKAGLLKMGKVVLERRKPSPNQVTPSFSVGPPALSVGSSPRRTQWGKNASSPLGRRGNSSQENSHALFNYFKKGQRNNVTPRRGRGTGAGKEASLQRATGTQHTGLTGTGQESRQGEEG